VVEAVPEAERLKRQVFQALDGLAPAHAILASNTSSIAITRLAAATRRPDRVVGLHFMNPVRGNVMGLAGGRAGGHCIALTAARWLQRRRVAAADGRSWYAQRCPPSSSTHPAMHASSLPVSAFLSGSLDRSIGAADGVDRASAGHADERRHF
jgi:hypothetical protein